MNGGLLRHVLIRANTATTVFRANIAEDGGEVLLNYDFHQGEINDSGKAGVLPLPVLGRYTVNITNASPDDTFQIRFVVQE